MDKTSTLEPRSVVIIVLRVFNRRKRFRAFPQPASVPRIRPFPESLECFPRPPFYPFVKEKPVSTLVFKSKNVFSHLSRRLAITQGKPEGKETSQNRM